MAGKRKLAPGHERFEFKPGVGGFPEWEGLDLRGDSSAIGANRLVRADNVYFIKKDLKVRGGQSKLYEDSIASPVAGIFETCEDPIAAASQKIWGFEFGMGEEFYNYSEPVVDASAGYFYLLRYTDDMTIVEFLRFPKPIAGEENILYNSSIGRQFAGISGIGAKGLTTGAFRTVKIQEGTSVGSLDVKNDVLSGASGGIYSLYGVRAGVAYFGAYVAGPTLKVIKYDTNTDIATLLASYGPSSAESIKNNFGDFNGELVGVLSLPPSSTHTVAQASPWTLHNLAANRLTVPVTRQRTWAVVGSEMWIAGSGSGGESVIIANTSFAFSSASIGGGLSVDKVFNHGGTAYALVTLDSTPRLYTFAAGWSLVGTYTLPGSAAALTVLGGDGRLYAYGTNNFIRRTGVGSFHTGYSDFGQNAVSGSPTFLELMP